MNCLLAVALAMQLYQPCEPKIELGLDRSYVFSETPYRPLSSAFEIDTSAYVRRENLSLSLDLWRNPSAGNPRSATGIDLWSLMIGWSF